MKLDPYYAALSDDLHRITRHSEKGLEMGFNKETANVEPMDYDFTDFGVVGKKATGTIPEPSQKMMKDFQREVQAFRKDAVAVNKQLQDDDLTDEQFAERTAAGEALEANLDTAISKLCSNIPPVEIVEQLPFRAKNAFSEWLMEQFNPKA